MNRTFADFQALSDIQQLEMMLHALKSESNPSNVFGDDVSETKNVKRKLFRYAHPDTRAGADDDPVAEAVFKELNRLWKAAQVQIDAGTYGTNYHGTMPVDNTTPAGDIVQFHLHGQLWSVGEMLFSDEIATTYRMTSDQGSTGFLRVVEDPANNDLLEHEAIVLQKINSSVGFAEMHDPDLYTGMDLVFPTLVGSIMQNGTHMSNLYTIKDVAPQVYPLAQVAATYDQKIPLKHIGWMWNRIVSAITWLHDRGIIHAALTPDNLIIDPVTHSVHIVNLSHASIAQDRVRSMAAEWTAIYPEEILTKALPQNESDTYMAAMSLIWAFCGLSLDQMAQIAALSPKSDGSERFAQITELPAPMARYMRWCTISASTSRPFRYEQMYDGWMSMIREELGWPKGEFVVMDYSPVAQVQWSWWW